jgi:hypothetical protein
VESVYLSSLANVLAVLTDLSNARLHSIRLANGSFEASSSASTPQRSRLATARVGLAKPPNSQGQAEPVVSGLAGMCTHNAVPAFLLGPACNPLKRTFAVGRIKGRLQPQRKNPGQRQSRRSSISNPRARSRAITVSAWRSQSSIWRTGRPAASSLRRTIVARLTSHRGACRGTGTRSARSERPSPRD